jgi:hypothetical protein
MVIGCTIRKLGKSSDHECGNSTTDHSHGARSTNNLTVLCGPSYPPFQNRQRRKHTHYRTFLNQPALAGLQVRGSIPLSGTGKTKKNTTTKLNNKTEINNKKRTSPTTPINPTTTLTSQA